MLNFNIIPGKIVNLISNIEEKSKLKIHSTFLNNWESWNFCAKQIFDKITHCFVV